MALDDLTLPDGGDLSRRQVQAAVDAAVALARHIQNMDTADAFASLVA